MCAIYFWKDANKMQNVHWFYYSDMALCTKHQRRNALFQHPCHMQGSTFILIIQLTIYWHPSAGSYGDGRHMIYCCSNFIIRLQMPHSSCSADCHGCIIPWRYLGHPKFVSHEMDLVGDPQKYQHMVVSVDLVKGYELKVRWFKSLLAW